MIKKQDYAKMIGESVRTIDRWIEAGRYNLIKINDESYISESVAYAFDDDCTESMFRLLMSETHAFKKISKIDYNSKLEKGPCIILYWLTEPDPKDIDEIRTKVVDPWLCLPYGVLFDPIAEVLGHPMLHNFNHIIQHVVDDKVRTDLEIKSVWFNVWLTAWGLPGDCFSYKSRIDFYKNFKEKQ